MVRLTPPMSSDAKIPEYDAVPDHPRIWLQPFAGDNGGHTWCSERIENEDIEYVRLDVHQAALLAEEQRGRKAGLEEAATVADADDGKALGGFGNPDFGPNVARRIAAAIRSLGEKP